MNPEIILADDITGAGDSGIHFAAAGKRTALLLKHNSLEEAFQNHDVVTMSSESRFLNPAAAAQAARQALRTCATDDKDIGYKKIDSTLRGNPGAEVEAMLDAGNFQAALVCPAMPKTGRTVRGGKLFVHNRPLDATESGRDPFNPVASAMIAEILGQQTRLPIAHVGIETIRSNKESLKSAISSLLNDGVRIVIADAVEDGDLAILAGVIQAFRGPPLSSRLLPVGAGGLAEALAGPPRPYSGVEPRGRMLAVVGSLTKASMTQIDHAAMHGGFQFLDMDVEAAMVDASSESRRLTAEIIPDNRHLLLKNRVPPLGRIDAAGGARAAEAFAKVAGAITAAAKCSILYATGGSTAMAILEALGVNLVTLRRECMPGVVLSSVSCENAQLQWFISKAGGFGSPETIVRIAEETLQTVQPKHAGESPHE